jgi:hypothetical protein
MAPRIGMDEPGFLVPVVGQKTLLPASLLLSISCAADHRAAIIRPGGAGNSLDINR